MLYLFGDTLQLSWCGYGIVSIVVPGASSSHFSFTFFLLTALNHWKQSYNSLDNSIQAIDILSAIL